MSLQMEEERRWGNVVLSQPEMFPEYWTEFPPPSGRVFGALGMLIAIVAIVSIVGNALSCYVMIRSKQLRKSKVLNINVAISDFLSCILTYHMFVVASYYGYWPFPRYMCYYYAIVQGLMGIVSIVTMSVIALQRYGKSATPNNSWAVISGKKLVAVILFIWLYSVMVVAPPLFGMGKYVAAGFLNTCCYDYIDTDFHVRAFILYLFTLGFGLPMTVVLYAYYHIYLQSREEMRRLKILCRKSLMESVQFGLNALNTTDNLLSVPKTRTPSPRPEVSSIYSDYEDIHISEADVAKMKEENRKAMKQLTLVIAVFNLAWLPYGVVSILGQFGPEGIISPWMAMIPSLIAKSSTLYNPILFAYSDDEYRKEIQRIVFFGFNKTTTAPPVATGPDPVRAAAEEALRKSYSSSSRGGSSSKQFGETPL